MLAPAHVGHLGLLQNWIKGGAAEESFDRELASDSAESALFFANLRQVLVAGTFVQETFPGRLIAHSASGYVYFPEQADAPSGPIGFGLFKEFPHLGYELWLTGLDRAWRGHGHGRAMLASMLATPVGQLAYIVRVDLAGASGSTMQHLLESLNFSAVRDTSNLRWFVRADAPADVAARIHAARAVRPSVQ